MAVIETKNNLEQARYEAHVDGVLAGFADYTLTDALITFTHTEVSPAFERQGIGSSLARFALDDVRRDGQRRVVPRCPFIKGWIRRHPDYRPLMDDPAKKE